MQRCRAGITEAITQMGEATAQDVGLAIPLAEVKGLGNKLRHECRRIEDDVIYKTVREDIPPLRDAATTCALAAE